MAQLTPYTSPFSCSPSPVAPLSFVQASPWLSYRTASSSWCHAPFSVAAPPPSKFPVLFPLFCFIVAVLPPRLIKRPLLLVAYAVSWSHPWSCRPNHQFLSLSAIFRHSWSFIPPSVRRVLSLPLVGPPNSGSLPFDSASISPFPLGGISPIFSVLRFFSQLHFSEPFSAA